MYSQNCITSTYKEQILLLKVKNEIEGPALRRRILMYKMQSKRCEMRLLLRP